MLDFVMNERPAEVRRWLKQPLTKKEIKRIMSKDRKDLTYQEIVIKGRILQEQNPEKFKEHLAPEGARVPNPHPKSNTLYESPKGTRTF